MCFYSNAVSEFALTAADTESARQAMLLLHAELMRRAAAPRRLQGLRMLRRRG